MVTEGRGSFFFKSVNPGKRSMFQWKTTCPRINIWAAQIGLNGSLKKKITPSWLCKEGSDESGGFEGSCKYDLNTMNEILKEQKQQEQKRTSVWTRLQYVIVRGHMSSELRSYFFPGPFSQTKCDKCNPPCFLTLLQYTVAFLVCIVFAHKAKIFSENWRKQLYFWL